MISLIGRSTMPRSGSHRSRPAPPHGAPQCEERSRTEAPPSYVPRAGVTGLPRDTDETSFSDSATARLPRTWVGGTRWGLLSQTVKGWGTVTEDATANRDADDGLA